MSREKGEAQGVDGAGEETVAALACMRPPEVARKLGISREQVMRLLRKKLLPGFKLGRVWMVRKNDLDHYLRRLIERCQAANPDLKSDE